MSRRFVALAGAGLVACGLTACDAKNPFAPSKPVTPPADGGQNLGTVPIGEALYAGKPYTKAAPEPVEADPVVIPQCHLTIMKRVDIPTQIDGQLYFIGVEVKAGDPP